MQGVEYADAVVAAEAMCSYAGKEITEAQCQAIATADLMVRYAAGEQKGLAGHLLLNQVPENGADEARGNHKKDYTRLQIRAEDQYQDNQDAEQSQGKGPPHRTHKF